MKTTCKLSFFILILISITGIAQTTELTYDPILSEERKGTKPKQLEGLEGTIEKVLVTNRTDQSITLEVSLTGYQGKSLKAVASNASGSANIGVIPKLKRLSSRRERQTLELKLELRATKEISTEYIELVVTNGPFRFKGVSHVYKLKKTWKPMTMGTVSRGIAVNDADESQSKIIELRMVPKEKAKKKFIRN